MGLAKTLKKRVVWVLHNKYSHHKEKDNWIDFMYRFMMKKSDLIITHSNSGVDFVKENYPEFSSKVRMIFHPMQQMISRTSSVEKKYDLLIWGSIFPYKGILQFLKFVKENEPLSTLKILVVGRCRNEEYKRQLLDSMTANITFYDKVYEMEDILRFAGQSRFTLFTYKSHSVISSGSLMDSISMGSKIIGPNHGAFRDLREYSFMKTYDGFEDLVPIIAHANSNEMPDEQGLRKFCEMNSWDSFVKKLEVALGQED
jgi:glycosyltransferase involved in cell wall biosynthesis